MIEFLSLIILITQVLVALPFWTKWSKIKETPSKIENLQEDLKQLEEKQKEDIHYLKQVFGANILELKEEIKDINKDMKTLELDANEIKLEFSKVLGKVNVTLKELEGTMKGLDKTMQDLKEYTKEQLSELKHKINGSK